VPGLLQGDLGQPPGYYVRLVATTSVAQVVAQAVEVSADAPAIFDRVRAMAAAAAGAPAPAPVSAGVSKGRKRPPRLTEAWFC
jgi:hypothetical protein